VSYYAKKKGDTAKDLVVSQGDTAWADEKGIRAESQQLRMYKMVDWKTPRYAVGIQLQRSADRVRELQKGAVKRKKCAIVYKIPPAILVSPTAPEKYGMLFEVAGER
jgi:hypothetical protein